MARPGNIEPTATNQATWNRKASERINFLLALTEAQTVKIADLEARVVALETA